MRELPRDPSMASRRPDWLDVKEYPFRSRFIDTPHGAMHYIDEGAGEVILLLHGNPTWSFMYRSLIRGLSRHFRCVAPDHIGFGLSDKPFDVSYRPQFHAANLERFVEALGLRDITLVLHDWGGPIGVSYALDHPDNVRRLIVFNTWFWSVEGNRDVENFSRIVGGPLGRFACRYLNAFPRFVMPSALGNKATLGKATHRHYIKPFPTPKSRKGSWVFPKAIVGESEWLASLWARRDRLAAKPVQLLWGLKDPGLGKRGELARWQEAFPRHEALTFPEIGHFVPEELGAEAVDPVEAFLQKAR